jgi:hypothetical protein
MDESIINLLKERQKKMSDAHQKAEALINGRDLLDLNDDELDILKEIRGDNFLDPRNEEHKRIIDNRKIFYEREKYLKIYNNRVEIDYEVDGWYGLNLHAILRGVNYIGSIANEYQKNSFYFHIVSDLAFIHDMRKLYFDVENAKALANPDESTMSDSSMNDRGYILYGTHAYDLNLEVTIDKREYDDMHLRDAFCFFFALKLSQIELMHLERFLDYQLKVTFESDFVKFKSFLTPLLIQYKIKKFDAFDNDEREIITSDLADLVKDWLSTKPNTIPPLTWTNDLSKLRMDIKEIIILPPYLPYFAQKLRPFFSDDDFKALIILLEGKEITGRITFKNSASMLGYFFRVMYEKEIITSEKKITAEWLAKYFNFLNQKAKDVSPFNYLMAQQYLTRKTQLKGKSTIDTIDFDEFEKKFNVK